MLKIDIFVDSLKDVLKRQSELVPRNCSENGFIQSELGGRINGPWKSRTYGETIEGNSISC